MQPNKVEYLHPYIISNLENIYNTIEDVLGNGITCKIISGYRNPKEQFELFKQGRNFKNGNWEVTDSRKVLTDKDGYIFKSAHNYLPSAAIDLGLFDAENRYICSQQQYVGILQATGLKLKWQIETQYINRQPQLEVPSEIFFQHNIEKDNAMLWQTLLYKAGTYFGEIDGIFGYWSTKALATATGQKLRSLIAWDMLHHPVNSETAISA